MPVIAHGSGLDELIAFLSVPALFLLYMGLRKLTGRSRAPEGRDREDPDEQRAGPAAR